MNYRSAIKHWWFSLLLLVAYLGIFNFWTFSGPAWPAPTSVLLSLVLAGGMVWSGRRHYFLNAVDASMHALVILDILLEGTLLREHDSRGFYWCALGFAVVVGGYRAAGLRRMPDRSPG